MLILEKISDTKDLAVIDKRKSCRVPIWTPAALLFKALKMRFC